MAAPQLVTATVTVETSALDAGDVANAAIIPFVISTAQNGYSGGKIMSLLIIDPDHNTAANIAGTLWLFKASVTQAAADAAHSVSDGDMLNLIGMIPIASGDVLLTAANSAACVRLAAPLPFDLAGGTTIYGIYVVTATPTFAGGSLTFVLGIA